MWLQFLRLKWIKKLLILAVVLFATAHFYSFVSLGFRKHKLSRASKNITSDGSDIDSGDSIEYSDGRHGSGIDDSDGIHGSCLLYTSPRPRDS